MSTTKLFVVKPLLKCPLPYLVRSVPFLFFVFLLFFVVGLARSVALRSPKGGAVRAERRARPTTTAPRSLLTSWLVAALLGGPPLATGGCSAAPPSAVPPGALASPPRLPA